MISSLNWIIATWDFFCFQSQFSTTWSLLSYLWPCYFLHYPQHMTLTFTLQKNFFKSLDKIPLTFLPGARKKASLLLCSEFSHLSLLLGGLVSSSTHFLSLLASLHEQRNMFKFFPSEIYLNTETKPSLDYLIPKSSPSTASSCSPHQSQTSSKTASTQILFLHLPITTQSLHLAFVLRTP